MAPLKFLIGGVWKSSERIKAILNPADDSTVGEACLASARDVDAAIGAAASASPAAAQLASYERSAILRKTAAAIGSRKEEFARIMTRETGKPITSSRSEVDRSILTFEVAAEEATRIGGEVLPLDLASHSRGRFGMVRRFPIGPVGAITPFNFPLNLVAHKVAPAIAAGNPVVLKPSSSGIMTALKLGEVMMECDVPAGLINIIPCSSGEAEQLITDERIKLISFTGSPAVGWPLKGRAGKKRVVLELGGNAGVIVDRTAPLEFAIPRIVQGSYGNAGQSCIAVQRIFVHHDLYEACERRFVELTRQVKVGDPMDETTAVGPMITAEAAAQIEGWIQEAVAAGSRVLCGGGRKRAFLEPTVLVNVRTDLNVSCREVFAPVVTLEPFDDFKDAVAKVNASAYGLQAGVFSNDLAHVLYAYHTLEVGGVIANDFPTYRIDHMPYGGEKDSGFGREGLRYAIEEMTALRLLAFNVL
jgi:acyl-CoA reductase-like NAD-dependent aldehyde dehydrogenase